MDTKLEKVADTVVAELRNADKEKMDKDRKENPDKYPEYISIKKILGDEDSGMVSGEISTIEHDEGEYQGEAIERRVFKTNDNKIITLSGTVVIKDADRFIDEVSIEQKRNIIKSTDKNVLVQFKKALALEIYVVTEKSDKSDRTYRRAFFKIIE